MKRIFSILFLVLALAVVSSQAALAGSELQQGGKAYYVAWGDSLDSIAARHGVSVEAILRQNGLVNPDLIYVGQLLIIPTSGYGHMPGNYSGYDCSTYHIVRPGETLSGIAWSYGTTVHALLQNNNLYNKDFVYVEQKLCIPDMGYGSMPDYNHDDQAGYAKPDYPKPEYRHHTVGRGETLTSIAYHYGINHWSIVEANRLNNASYIWVGQALLIPVSQSSGMIRDYSDGHDSYKKDVYMPAPEHKHDDGAYFKPDHKKDQYYVDKKSKQPDVYLRLGRNVDYEYWGRPQLGLDDCTDWYDDSQTVKRLTVEVILTNNSKHEISGDWASLGNVVIGTAGGAHRYACKHVYGYGSPALTAQGKEIVVQNQDSYPKALAPGGTVNVTFYTHMEKDDFATKIEFKKLGICFDPNSGDRISCDINY